MQKHLLMDWIQFSNYLKYKGKTAICFLMVYHEQTLRNTWEEKKKPKWTFRDYTTSAFSEERNKFLSNHRCQSYRHLRQRQGAAKSKRIQVKQKHVEEIKPTLPKKKDKIAGLSTIYNHPLGSTCIIPSRQEASGLHRHRQSARSICTF